MTGMSTGQTPVCFGEIMMSMKLIVKGNSKNKNKRNSSSQQMVPQFIMLSYYGLYGQLANCFVN